MTTGHGAAATWHAARTPAAWHRHVATAIAPCVDFDRAGAGVDALARQRPVVCPEPTWGAVVGELVAGTPGDQVAPRPRPQPRPARTRPTTWGPTPSPGGGPVASRPAATGGIGHHAATPGTARPTDPSTSTTAVSQLPRPVDQAVLLRAAGHRPTQPATARGPHERPLGRGRVWAAELPDNVVLPTPARAAATWVDHAVQRLARRLGTDPASCADILAGAVVRSGPAVDLPALRHLAGAATTNASSPGTGTAPDRGNDAVGSRPLAQPPEPAAKRVRDDASHARSSARRAIGNHDRAADTSTAPRPPPTPGGDTADTGRGSRYAELPTRDDVLRHPEPRDTAAHDDARPWSAGDRRSSHVHDDLEARITQLLDEAARRHGIEV